MTSKVSNAASPSQPKRQAKPRWQKVLYEYLGSWQLYVLLLPAVAYVFIFNYMPMYGIQIAFKDFRTSLGIWDSEWVGFRHFIRFINFPNFGLIMTNTLRIGAYTLATFPLSVILALMLNELRNQKFKKTVQMITYAPFFMSTVVVCSLIILFFNRDVGVINNLREMFGLERVQFMSEASAFPHLLVWSIVWQNLGWGTIIYLASLSNVSPELIEAARIDGANRFDIIRHVNIPCILPTIVIMFILASGNVMSVGFERVFLLQTPLNLSRSQVIATYVYEVGLIGAQFSYASAIGLFNAVINVALILMVNLVAKKVTNVGLW